MATLRYFTAYGKVQNVMFRQAPLTQYDPTQTLVRAAIKRNLRGGATNSPHDKNEVTFTLAGDNAKIQEIVDFLSSGKPMNSWGAQVTRLEETATGKAIEEHQVHDGNVDKFKWKQNVTFYL